MPPPSPHMRNRARALRARATREETLLWSLVRNNQLGVHVRRQHPMGDIVVDFYCHEARLAIELDGAHHHRLFDDNRDADLADREIHVLRFPNWRVRKEIEQVLQEIREEIKLRRSPFFRPPGGSPSPGTGEGVGGGARIPLVE